MNTGMLSGRLALLVSLISSPSLFGGCVATDETLGDDEDVGQDDDAVDVAITLTNPGFESSKTGWGNPDLFAISTSDKRSGSRSAKISGSNGRIQQKVTVSPNTSYVLSAWVLGKGTVGVKSGAQTLGSQSIQKASWTQATVTFNSGNATSVDIFGAYNGGEGRFDDFAMAKVSGGGGGSGGSGAGGSGGSGAGGSGAGGSGGSGGNITLPAQLLNLTNWHLTLPVDTAHPGDPDQIEQPQLATFKHDTFFFLNPAQDGVVFRAYADGQTTSGSGYPRSELRERKNGGKDKAAWSSSSGKHTMFIDQAVTHLPVVKPHIVVGQIHDGGDDVIVIRLEGSKLFIDLNGNDGPTLTSSYALGQRFNVKLEVENNATTVYYNGTPKYTYPKQYSGAYFKAGAYVQSSCQGTKKVSGESCSAYGEVVIYDVWVQHE
jgi:hypothetical protein